MLTSCQNAVSFARDCGYSVFTAWCQCIILCEDSDACNFDCEFHRTRDGDRDDC